MKDSGTVMTRRKWLGDLTAQERDRLPDMTRSLSLFENGTLRLFHDEQDVSGEHIDYLRKVIADTNALIERIGAEKHFVA